MVRKTSAVGEGLLLPSLCSGLQEKGAPKALTRSTSGDPLVGEDSTF